MIENQIPRESQTGLRDTPCLVFGNGVEIETVVYAKTTQENSKESKDGRTILLLPKRIGQNVEGQSIVKVHFLPKTDQHDRANDPSLVLEEEKKKVALDALEGFLLLAEALKNGKVEIRGNTSEDFYLYADTNPQFAAFLRGRCGFRGTVGGSEVWIKKSEFISPQNIEQMKKQKQLFSS